jgi:tRNA A64-2'-O-ribosylphosphate transferase
MSNTPKNRPRDTFYLLNRTRSIQHDAKFVSFCAKKFPFPIVANERAGKWYIDPALRNSIYSAYFKSTDGHFGQWDFSLKRLNLHILPIIVRERGCIIVDTTKRGKRYPDSLSKTVPIWCLVISTVIHQLRQNLHLSTDNWDLGFNIPSLIVSETEKQQIVAKLPGFMQKLRAAELNLEDVARIMEKPLKPIWVHPSSRMFSQQDEDEEFWSTNDIHNLDYYPVICLSASISVSQDLEANRFPPLFPPPNTFEYVQGAADDSESWAPKLTPAHFWEIQHLIDDSLSLGALQEMIEAQVSKSKPLCYGTRDENLFDWIGNSKIAIGNIKSAEPPKCWDDFDLIINCGAPRYTYKDNQKVFYLDIPEGKKGSKSLYDSIDVVVEYLLPRLDLCNHILIHCMQGVDRSVGIAIAILLRFGDSNRILRAARPPKHDFSKQDVMNTLLYIKNFRPIANPTRATMKRLNEYFIRNL